MKFTCNRAKLHDALSLLASVVPQRSAKPILHNIKIAGAGENQIELFATDLEVGIRYILEVETLEKSEEVVLPSAELSNIVRDAWGESISIKIEDNRAHITTEGAKFTFSGESADEYPIVPEMDEKEAVEIRAEDLETAIQQTIFATAREEQQYSLAGVYIVMEKKQLEMVTTDTFRLALARRPLRQSVKNKVSAIVLAKGMTELSRLLAGEELVKLQLSQTQFFAKTSRATVVSRLIESKFPQYENIIPKDLGKKITVNRVRCIEALKQAANMANKETHAIVFSGVEGILRINAVSAHGAEGKVEIAAEVEGGEVSASFNYTYLLDVLRVLQDEKVVINLRDAESPARIDSKGYTYVVSPVCQ